jgi:hypothetical protein
MAFGRVKTVSVDQIHNSCEFVPQSCQCDKFDSSRWGYCIWEHPLGFRYPKSFLWYQRIRWGIESPPRHIRTASIMAVPLGTTKERAKFITVINLADAYRIAIPRCYPSYPLRSWCGRQMRVGFASSMSKPMPPCLPQSVTSSGPVRSQIVRQSEPFPFDSTEVQSD